MSNARRFSVCVLLASIVFAGCKPRGDSASRIRADEAQAPLGNGDYYLVLDLDETLLFQGSDPTFADLRGVVVDDLPADVYVKFAPHAEDMIRCSERFPHCRGVFVDSVKRDAAANDILSRWLVDGYPVLTTWLKGALSRSANVVGKDLLKDLRKIDPTLQHVVIVDDNPRRVIQKHLLRAVPRYSAPLHKSLQVESGPRARALWALYDGMLEQAMDDINAAAAAAEGSGKTFAEEFQRFSYAAYALPDNVPANFDANLARTLQLTLDRAGVDPAVAATLVKDPAVLKPRGY